MRPVICMITARQAPSEAATRALVERIGVAARAGVHLVQIRQPDFQGRLLARLVEDAMQAARGTPARVVVNERLDVAQAVGAPGVHLRGGSMPGARVRALVAPGFLVGRSVHSRDEAAGVAAAGGLDYLIFGTIFATGSKPGAAVGTPALADACAAVPVPVLAVGGMTPERLGAVAAAGAAGFAAIGLFADCALDAVHTVVGQAVRAFDTPAGVP